MKADYVDERLLLIEEGFQTLAECVRELRAEKVAFESDAISSGLASIGAELMVAKSRGIGTERRILLHWKQNGKRETNRLIRRSRNRRITTEEMNSIFHKPPGPEL